MTAGELERLGSLRNLRTFWDFDGRVTAPLNGFRDVHDYYRRASSHFFLGQNRTPTLIIHSSDDPFVSATACRRPVNWHRRPVRTAQPGGHVGLSTAACAIRGTTWSGGFRSGWWTAAA
jgi:predicted alpha/beta-fold hydrolase